MRYKGTAGDAAKVAAELGVDSVMTGRLSQIGDNLNISVQLIDVKAGKVLWAEQYDRKMSDLLATQREIATTITQKLELKLSGNDAKGITKKYTDNNEAYQLYLKGRFHWNKRDEESLRKAIEQFKAAADKDTSFALALVGLADSYAVLPYYSTAASSEVLPQAKIFATVRSRSTIRWVRLMLRSDTYTFNLGIGLKPRRNSNDRSSLIRTTERGIDGLDSYCSPGVVLMKLKLSISELSNLSRFRWSLTTILPRFIWRR